MKANIMNPYQTAPLVHIVCKIDYLMKISRRQKSYNLMAAIIVVQGWHRLEKYLNIQDCLEKSLKIKFALKST